MPARASYLLLPAGLSLLLVGRPVSAQAPDEATSPSRPAALIIPQTEGAKHGRVVGRAIACGVERARTEAALSAARDRMRAAVGARFTEERYLPSLAQAIDFEGNLGRPSDEACAKALEAFAQFEAIPAP